MCLSCFGTARYDRAHTQRVSNIHARHDAALERERAHHAALLAELDSRRALAVPIDHDAGDAPVNRVDRREGIATCRAMCGIKPGDPIDPARSRSSTAQCLRDVCLPAYVDALVKTYARADMARVEAELSRSRNADLESLLAHAHNEALLANLDREAAILAQRSARVRSRIEQQRQRDLEASMQLRDTEIAARRARVKAAADAFAAEARRQPATAPVTAPPATASPAASDPSGESSPRDCAGDPSCASPVPASSVSCVTEAGDTIARAPEPASRPAIEPLLPIACTDQRDCPSGLSCDLTTGVCCATVVR